MDPGVERAVSAGYLREIVERLSAFRSHPLGFRVAGTPEERAATRYIAGEMRGLGLVDVAEEPVPVDAWRLGEAFVELDGGTRYESASMGGVPETGPDGVRGELLFVGRGSRHDLDRVDVTGKVALVDWRDESLWPYEVALELVSRGAAAMLLTSFPGGPYYQGDGALGTFDAMWHAGGPPMVTVRKEDAAELLRHEGEPVRVVLVAPLARGAEAANVVGTLPGRRGGAVVVGGHHDGWFEAAFDDATGVAATLALARAYAEAGVRPRRPIVFVSHTAEEYGIAESRYDWCYGAWYQVVEAHREWGARAAFYL
ncbi:MAG: M28 family peptidase, partial [Thermoleophilia bacterium]|nr:M28 family peptidase [Thermoleophilia bacterium]